MYLLNLLVSDPYFIYRLEFGKIMIFALSNGVCVCLYVCLCMFLCVCVCESSLFLYVKFRRDRAVNFPTRCLICLVWSDDFWAGNFDVYVTKNYCLQKKVKISINWKKTIYMKYVYQILNFLVERNRSNNCLITKIKNFVRNYS